MVDQLILGLKERNINCRLVPRLYSDEDIQVVNVNPFTVGKSCQTKFPNSAFILCIQLISYVVVII